jgi:uncharacterized protein (TIGR03437 family)
MISSGAADVMTRPALNFSKTFGGSSSDTGWSVAVDPAGNVYVAGSTTSADFPTVSALQPQIGGAPLRITSDGGKTWSVPAIPSPVYAVAGSAKAPATQYAGTTAGIYRSVDSGKTWAPLPTAGTSLINALVADADASATVYAATSTGLLKSADSGATWQATGPAGYGLALAANPAQPATLIAAFNPTAARPTLYRTSDGGATWTLLSNSPIGPFALAFDAANPGVVYLAASTSGFASGGTISLYRSADNGNNWTRLTAPTPLLSTFALAAGAGQIYVGTNSGLQVSGDGGSTWKAAVGVTGAVGNVAVDPSRPQTAYAAGDGIFATTDGGATWSKISGLRQVVETLGVVPTTPPTLMVGAAPGRNVFVTKWSGDGKQMLYSTYLGGSYYESATGLAVDSQGNAYVTGLAGSTDFPVTSGALQGSNRGTNNAFLSKISPDGMTLIYSTYLGGSASDGAFAVAVDNSGNAYLTGAASSSDFPITSGAFQTSARKACAIDSPAVQTIVSSAFVSKIATGGTGLRYSSYLGGSCPDQGAAIAVDGSGSAYVVGATLSTDFPVTAGAMQVQYGGGRVSGFLAKLTPQGTGLAYSTFIGGAGQDAAFGVSVDSKGAAYVGGGTWGLDDLRYALGFISSSASAISPDSSGVGFGISLGGAAYALKVDATGSKRLYLKYLGGTNGYSRMLALDPSGNLWVAGNMSTTSSERFPTLHPFQAETGGSFVTQLAPDGQNLLFSSAINSARQVVLDASGNAFVVGSTVGLSISTIPKSGTYVSLTRIDGAVASTVTVEDPSRFVPGLKAPVDYGIAGGEILVLTGLGLGPAVEVGAQLTPDGRVPTSLAGTTVTFGGVAAPLLSVQAQKIVCIAPFSVTSKGATLQVQSGGALSNSIVLPTALTAIEPLATVNQDGATNSAAHPAAAGSIVTVYVAGFGQTNPAGVDGQIVAGTGSLTVSQFGVNISGQAAQILYAGPAPGEVAGVTQINFRVPQLAPGTYTVNLGWGPPSGPAPFAVDYHSVSLVIGQP